MNAASSGPGEGGLFPAHFSVCLLTSQRQRLTGDASAPHESSPCTPADTAPQTTSNRMPPVSEMPGHADVDGKALRARPRKQSACTSHGALNFLVPKEEPGVSPRTLVLIPFPEQALCFPPKMTLTPLETTKIQTPTAPTAPSRQQSRGWGDSTVWRANAFACSRPWFNPQYHKSLQARHGSLPSREIRPLSTLSVAPKSLAAPQ